MRESFSLLTIAVIVLISSTGVVKSDNYSDSSPLRITQHPRSQVAVKGARVSFRCEYEVRGNGMGNGEATVKWLFEDLPTLINGPIKLRPLTDIDQFEFDQNAIHILSYDPQLHTGLYRCVVNSSAVNPPTVLLSMPANLSLAQIQGINGHKSDVVKLDLSEGNVAHITCSLPYSNPQAVPQFYFNHQPIPILTTSTRYKILPSGSLQISNARLSDSGVYSCSALNPLTLAVINSTATHLRVYNPASTIAPAIVHPPQETNRVLVGANLTLECVAQGAPVPLVTWEKFGGGQLPEGRASQIMGNLLIVDVREEDRGTYVCRAENGPGQATFKTALVEVFEAPRLVMDEPVVVKRGDRIEVKCPIRGRPRPDVYWFRDGVLIESNKNGHRVTNIGDKSVVFVDSHQLNSQPVMYQCFARNEYGSNQADVLVNPSASSQSDVDSGRSTPKRPQIILGPQNTTIYEGQSVVLLCVTNDQSTASGGVSSGTGNTQINWLQNDLIIEPTLMRRFEINQLLGNLRIVSVQKSDAGVYKCIASNEYGMSTAEAYVTVKSVGTGSASNRNIEELKVNQRKPSNNPQTKPVTATSNTLQSSRPTVQQIGADKILLRWNIVDAKTGSNVDVDQSALSTHPSIAYFKVDYKTNSPRQHSQWLTIDEQIDPKKREYILTDLSRSEAYRFRITTFFVNGELSHSHQSTRFRLDADWVAPQTTPTLPQATPGEFRLSDIHVQISQIWAISSSSLGLKWDIQEQSQAPTNRSTAAELFKHINGFYIYYRKIDTGNSQDVLYETPASVNVNANPVPIYNYTRINIPISQVESSQDHQSNVVIQNALIDTYIIANLAAATQYEIKMTCYNLNGDLCSFSAPIYGLTLSETSSSSARPTRPHVSSTLVNQQSASSSSSSSKQNEILFMILGIVLGALTLLLALFIIMCVIRHRQHSKLLAQLHNTSHKLTSSSCPTLIYEDSLRQAAAAAHAASQHHLRHMLTQQQGVGSYASSKLIDTANLFVQSGAGPSSSSGNDSNSTNSQSMSTTTSSMTTPPGLNSADNQHILVLNGSSSTNKPPPIPQHPPPPIISSNPTLNHRININLNPLNNYIDGHHEQSNSQSGGENFYHTLTTLGTLPNETNHPDMDYTNTTLNMQRAHLLLKQQQQQIIVNTLKTLNLRSKQQQFLNQQQAETGGNPRSPSVGSMKRHGSATSSKRSKKGAKSNKEAEHEIQASSQPTNYYLLPNIRSNQGGPAIINPILANRNIYNEMDLLTLEAALNQNNLANLILMNQAQNQTSTFLPHQQPPSHHLLMTTGNESLGPLLFGNGTNSGINFIDSNGGYIQQATIMSPSLNRGAKETTDKSPEYEDGSNRGEEEPMLANHYASSGILKDDKSPHNEDESRKLI